MNKIEILCYNFLCSGINSMFAVSPVFINIFYTVRLLNHIFLNLNQIFLKSSCSLKIIGCFHLVTDNYLHMNKIRFGIQKEVSFCFSLSLWSTYLAGLLLGIKTGRRTAFYFVLRSQNINAINKYGPCSSHVYGKEVHRMLMFKLTATYVLQAHGSL